jgi:hypothetical protein
MQRSFAMLKTHLAAALAALAVTGPSLASETCTTEPQSKWLSHAEISAKLKQQGFDVSRLEADRSCYEVKARDAQGRRVELYVDPVTARIVRSEAKNGS